MPSYPSGQMTTVSTYCTYDPKQNGTFHSARWKKDYSPDLCFVTCDDEHQPLPTTRIIEPRFPSSQHRPGQHYHDRLGHLILTNNLVGANLTGISGKQTGLSLRKASLEVSIEYHRGVKTTNASANLSSPINEEMAALDSTHSGRRAWSLLRKLGGATHSKRQQPKVTVNEVAHQLLLNGSVKKARKQATHILKQQREACTV